jgi:PAS domain-containing protein
MKDMNGHVWVDELPVAITVCDANGTIVDMNERAAETFQSEGGRALIGTDVLACHPEPARTKLGRLLASNQRNVYTVEKRGVKKLIYQSPWFEHGRYAGFVELSLELPADIPHFVREG